MPLDLASYLLKNKLSVEQLARVLAPWHIRSKTSRDRAGWTTVPVMWRGENDQHLGITSACF